ncbi:50S ribosomal protein L9 [bacterium]|nr:50S ribosomal protein L9 [bacterium]
MKVILRESYETLGRPGDIVDVKPGFARNYLVPQGIAYPANKMYQRLFDHERDELVRLDEKKRHDAEQLAGKATDVHVEFIVRLGDRGMMHGAITNSDIAEKLLEKGVEVDRRKIQLPEPIKTTGEHVIPVKLHADVGFDVHVTVTPEVAPDEDAEEGVDEMTTEEFDLEEAAIEAEAVDAEGSEVDTVENTDEKKAESSESTEQSTSPVEVVELEEIKPKSEKEENQEKDSNE